jgi:hypothetical protein
MVEQPGLLQVAREKMRTRHLAYRTEQAYLQWIRRYLRFHQRHHPRDLGAVGVEQFLTHLAVERKVSASTQNQALQALLFLYRTVLGEDLPWLEKVTCIGPRLVLRQSSWPLAHRQRTAQNLPRAASAPAGVANDESGYRCRVCRGSHVEYGLQRPDAGSAEGGC